MFIQVLAYAKPFWRTLVVITLLIVVMAGLNQVEPFITKQVTDILVDRPSDIPDLWSAIFTFLIILLAVKIFQSFLNQISLFLTSIFSVQFESRLKRSGFDHLMKLSLDFFSNQASGKVMSKLDRGVNRISSIVSNFGIHFLPSVTTALVSFSIVVYYEWRVAVLTILAFGPYVIINRWRFKKNRVLEKKEHRLFDEQYGHFYEVLSSMQLIKSFMAEGFERNKLLKFYKELEGVRRNMQWNNVKAVSGDFLLEVFSWSMYAYMVYLTWQQSITIGTLVFLVGLIQHIRGPLWQINWIYWEIKRAQIGAKDFMKIMNTKPNVVDPRRPVSLGDKIKGQVVFDQVSFTYKNENESVFASDKAKGRKKSQLKNLQVFDKISFTIDPGKMTAFVGPSGSGKTTIASLLMRFFDVDEGTISLDGIDVRKLKQQELRSYMGLVSQDANLFATTIRENLRYANPEATEKEMWAACRVAYADEFLKRMPDGLDTKVGERGVKLSGGQKQRLSLARTILRNPQIIILDEATSSLDSLSEMYIQRTLRKLLLGKTAIVIAHRLSTIQRADKIIVIKDKKVYEQGTHQELLVKDKLYASFFKIQSGDLSKLKEWDLVG